MRSDRPKYLAIHNELRSELAAGKYQLGERLPSIEALMHEHGAAMNTVRSAQELLAREGLVRAEQGRGVFVVRLPAPADASTADLVERKLSEAIRLLIEARSILIGAAP